MANGIAAPRCAALIGPYLSGKTTLLEALLHASGSTTRRGSVRDGNSVGDHSAEARARQMSTELNVAGATFLGDPWTILDCPGSVELLYEAQGNEERQFAAVRSLVNVYKRCDPEKGLALRRRLFALGRRHGGPAVAVSVRPQAVGARGWFLGGFSCLSVGRIADRLVHRPALRRSRDLAAISGHVFVHEQVPPSGLLDVGRGRSVDVCHRPCLLSGSAYEVFAEPLIVSPERPGRAHR